MNYVSKLSLGLVICLLVGTLGCSRSDKPSLAEVKGKLMKEGKPFVNAQVEFYPTVDGAASYGETDETGSFTLFYSTGDPGAAIGDHKVTVIGGHVAGDPSPPTPEVVAPTTSTEEMAEGTLQPVGMAPQGRSRNKDGSPSRVEGLTAKVESGANDIILNL
ncbi:hypothetical protein RMSM_07100 [Rhodopirellula maiorica SM1]|uniref:Uncharacterized protein n=1 Tax=Rhodopirellula maiorica SM1 TaxID=1265738 RepID=M5RPT8_9BACT|nr:hypothetical protein [Rhodopirellula maiorica]EMI15984.1 hypothetical protein RMSM_07100 [Rhodopirellula maiorica SM1]